MTYRNSFIILNDGQRAQLIDRSSNFYSVRILQADGGSREAFIHREEAGAIARQNSARKCFRHVAGDGKQIRTGPPQLGDYYAYGTETERYRKKYHPHSPAYFGFARVVIDGRGELCLWDGEITINPTTYHHLTGGDLWKDVTRAVAKYGKF